MQLRIASLYGTSFNNYPEAIAYGLKAVVSGEEADCLPCLAAVWANLGGFYNSVGDQSTALSYYKKAKDANTQLGNKSAEQNLNNNIGERYRLLGQYREAIPYYQTALSMSKDPYNIALTESNLADVYTHLNNLPLAFQYAWSSLATARQIEDNEGVAWVDAILARIYLKKGMADSALYYAKMGWTWRVKPERWNTSVTTLVVWQVPMR
jgi:tetratricopeptide (TPR) repeat protein